MAVYVIVGLDVNERQQVTRNIIGFFSLFNLSEKCVLENIDNIYADTNKYIVIEEITGGVHQVASGHKFYKWVDGQYVSIPWPKDVFDGIRNFATGKGMIKDYIQEMQDELECSYYPQCTEPEWIFSNHCYGCKLYIESKKRR